MNKPHARFWHSIARALGVAWSALFLAACGAGTGGTGSGPPAASADLSVKPGGTASLDARNTILGIWTKADISASFGASTIAVTQGCAKFEFAGEWSTDGNQQIRVQGTYTGCAPGDTSITATMVVQLDPAQPGATAQTLSVLITDASGQILLYQTLLIQSPQTPPTPTGTENTSATSE